MTITEIANQIALLIDRQAVAIANDDFDELEGLTTETGRLLHSLDAQAETLTSGERDQLVRILQPASDRSVDLIDTADARLSRTREELHELRHGRSATLAYRQSVQREAAISYSRHG